MAKFGIGDWLSGTKQADGGYALATASGALGPQTSAESQSITPATDAIFKNAGVGCVASASFTPTATPYLANDIMDVAKQFTFTYADGSTIPAGSKIRILDIILRIDQTALQGTEGAYALQPYTVTPPSAQADNAAWTLASGDLSAYCGPGINIGTPVDLGSACYVKAPNIDTDISLVSSSLWGELQTLAGFTSTVVVRQVAIIAVVL